jgi:hypothetical protein
VDVGRVAVLDQPFVEAGHLQDRVCSPVQEATVKDCGVAVAMLSG